MGTVAYDELLDFITGAPSPDAIIAFQPSEETRARVEELIRREKTSRLTDDEADELDRYMEFDRLMTLAKARAHRRLHQGT